MAAGHLVTHANLALLGNVDLGQLHDARRQLITLSGIVFVALLLGLELLIFHSEAVDNAVNQIVVRLVGRPFGRVDCQIINVFENFGRKLRAFGHNLQTKIVFHTLRSLAEQQRAELLDQSATQLGDALLEFLVDFGKNGLLARTRLAVLHDAREQALANHHAV